MYFLKHALLKGYEKREEKMEIVCLMGICGPVLFLTWALCKAAGREKELEDAEQEQYLREWKIKKLKK